MGWSGPMENRAGRMVGYAVSATCDLEGCDAKIDRGLAYVCGGMHDGDEHGCGDYFCAGHLFFGADAQLCAACLAVWEKEHTCPDCGETFEVPPWGEGDPYCAECKKEAEAA